MALFKYLKPRNLPDSEDTGLREEVTKQANIPVTAVLNENHEKGTKHTVKSQDSQVCHRE